MCARFLEGFSQMGSEVEILPERPPLKKRIRRARRASRERFAARRQSAYERSPRWVQNTLFRAYDYFDMLIVDHGIFRLVYSNRHQITGTAWRSSQPAPHQIAQMARRGVKTVLNLRGDRECGGFRLEQEACLRHGLSLVNFDLKSRAAPPREKFHEAKALFEQVEYPILMHCKSGADRAGLASVLFMHFKEGVPMADAAGQLDVKFGHFKKSDTGILDYVFERYIERNTQTPVDFLTWVDEIYDPVELEREFKAGSLTNVLVNKVLRRE